MIILDLSFYITTGRLRLIDPLSHVQIVILDSTTTSALLALFVVLA
jgi:hypothetical protein